ncbi:MAG: hypothetical protein IJU75_04155, partial [Clostridia bacterium]|nr:hypothetical protein [Clostridia bacterium]
ESNPNRLWPGLFGSFALFILALRHVLSRLMRQYWGKYALKNRFVFNSPYPKRYIAAFPLDKTEEKTYNK